MDLLTQVVREAPVPLWVIDRQGLVALANREAIHFLGYRGEDDVVGGPSHDLLHRCRPDGSPYPQHECPIVRSGGSDPASEWFVTRAGDTRPVRWSTRSIAHGDATILSFSAEPRGGSQLVRELRKRGPVPRTPAVQVRAELRDSLYRTIESRFTDPEFTTAELAAAAHLSVRTVQAVLRKQGRHRLRKSAACGWSMRVRCWSGATPCRRRALPQAFWTPALLPVASGSGLVWSRARFRRRRVPAIRRVWFSG
ncbi:PAS domain-containing protein [Arthrobacter sp. ATA002]|nr:PAS domain-containing protein [Arthrobacter sp. ATA002]WAP50566.1 PAS domain-containing protein [Arthrobacter sp. ATA002]